MVNNVADLIEDLLCKAFAPTHLEIIDETCLHRGHASAPDGGESHFRIILISDQFKGQKRVQRQRQVYKALDEVIRNRIHALSMTTLTPEEYSNC